MKLSFEDEESFKEAIESLRFNNPSSDPNARQQIGSSNSMSLEDSQPDSEGNEDNIIPSDDPITLRRVGSTNTLSIQETRRSGFVFNNPPSNPEFTGTSVNGI